MDSFLRDVVIIARKECWEQQKKRYLLIGMAMMAIAWVVNTVFIAKTVARVFPDLVLTMVSNTLLCSQLVSFFMLATFMFLVSLYSKEKQSGTMDCLLIAPLTPRAIWMGKTLFLCVTGLVFAYASVVLNLAVLNVVLRSGETMILPDLPATTFALIVFPVLAFAISALLGLIHLLFSNSAISSILYLFVGIAYLGVSSARVRSFSITWSTLVWYVALTLVLLLVVAALSRRLTPERIIMSGG